MSHDLPDDWYEEHDGQRLVLSSEKVLAGIARLQAVIDAARLYEKWARETGDYPHDEAGCEAHDAILSAIRSLGQ